MENQMGQNLERYIKKYHPDEAGFILAKTKKNARGKTARVIPSVPISYYNVNEEIGYEGSKILYQKDGIKSEWKYRLTSGEHEKNNGHIFISQFRKFKKDSVILIAMEIKKGIIASFAAYSNCSGLFSYHKKMPLYDFIKKNLKSG